MSLATDRAGADTDQGHLLWGALQQGMVGGSPVTACSDEFASSTQAAVSRWNSALGHATFQNYCVYPEVWVSTANFFDPHDGCGQLEGGGWPWACTRPAVFPPVGEGIANPTYVRLNPDMFPGQDEDADGGARTSRVITHEFGHVLGHADYDFGQFGGCDPPTVMDTWARCYFLADIVTPQPQDVTNYNDAYRPNAVTNLQGNSPAPGQVNLSWNPSNVHAEAFFSVWRWGVWVGDAAKNSSWIALSNQPSGDQLYGVWGHTNALDDHYGDPPLPDWVTVDVFGPRITSVFLFGPAPSVLSDAQGRYLWLIGSVQNPEPVAQEVRVRVSVTGHPSGCSQSGLEQPILPGSPQFWLSPGEVKWVLYRARYECHSPAPRGVYYLAVDFCVREASQSIDQHCRGYTRQLIVQ